MSNARKERLPEPKYYPDEATDIRKAAGEKGVSDFVRTAAVKAARRKLGK